MLFKAKYQNISNTRLTQKLPKQLIIDAILISPTRCGANTTVHRSRTETSKHSYILRLPYASCRPTSIVVESEPGVGSRLHSSQYVLLGTTCLGRSKWMVCVLVFIPRFQIPVALDMFFRQRSTVSWLCRCQLTPSWISPFFDWLYMRAMQVPNA